jgi:sec-independent protein translocase protein TatC
MSMPNAIAAAALRPVSHETRMTVVDHLEELRARLMVSLAALAVAFGFCFWQNHALLQLVNRPLANTTEQQARAGRGPLGATAAIQSHARDLGRQLQSVTTVLAHQTHDTADIAALAGVQRSLDRDVTALSAAPRASAPVTLGISEPFTATLTVTLIFALILSLPVLLLQAYGFFMPAMSAEHKRRLLPVLWSVPLLFAAGVAFGYAVVLPASLHFFQTFNSDQFDVLVQANQYYKYAAMILLAMGLLFEVPVAILAAVRAGVVTPGQLRRNRRWAILACVLIAAILPGDAITMALETAPLYLLFELSVLIAAFTERRAARAAARAG